MELISPLERLRQMLEPHIRSAVRLELAPHESARLPSTSSKFGGAPYAESGESWPVCPTCRKALTFVAQLEKRGEGLLFVFFYCFDCFPWGFEREQKGEWEVRTYAGPAMQRYQGISHKSQAHAEIAPCLATEHDVEVLPDWEGLFSTAPDAIELCREINGDSPWAAYDEAVEQSGCLNDYATLIGGYPRFVQAEAQGKCGICGNDMEFLAQIDSESEANLMWGDVGLVYVFHCRTHKEFYLALQCH